MTRSHHLSLFGRTSGSFPVPVETMSAVARRRGQGRPLGRRGSRLALDGDELGRTLPVTWANGRPSRAVRAAAAVLCLCMALAFAATGSAAPSTEDWRQGRNDTALVAHAVDEAALRFGLPRHWIVAVMMVESGGRVRAVSPKGAMGLLQLMPGTWRALSSELDLGDDPFEPRANVMAGAAYLRQMYDRFGAPGFAAAYNAGPARYERYLAGNATLPAETHAYVQRLRPLLQEPGQDMRRHPVTGWRGATLFVAPGLPLRAGEAVR
ncbi:lytic transglycosylase domain-containing protein [Caulobacter sp. UNC279MFTsu5.1]|uniref:lytic transglycosylase domain-containing protein n=1 Tax=Caulobacter sp. UNC279MFTsu5.1 TaxID=1502775 RepID=UPI002101A8A8|nr:lytic transglycosylase domain-containing protein [Caulobacter sp. UNC279MFTsu5.1]